MVVYAPTARASDISSRAPKKGGEDSAIKLPAGGGEAELGLRAETLGHWLSCWYVLPTASQKLNS